MRLAGPLLCVAVFCASMGAAAAPPLLLAAPDRPGPNEPPAGASLFDEVFAHRGGADLPYPFERLLDRLAPAQAVTVLIPLGRSLQRFGASPDYFESPRVVVAVVEDSGASGRPYLKDRLFLGFQQRAQAIEIISYNEAAGRFEFQVVEDYGPGLTPRVMAAERSICVLCHQGHGPIFPAALWSETNANPQVAERLSSLGERFNGAPVRGGVDQAEALDSSTDRAARLGFVNAIWTEGCAGERLAAARCRGELLLSALLFRLSGSRPEAAEAGRDLQSRIVGRMLRAAPGGLGAPSPDLPNRDPMALVLAGNAPDDVIEPDGVFDPLHPRAPIRFLADGAGTDRAPLSIDMAAAFSDADILRLDRTLAARAPTASMRSTGGAVEARALALDDGRKEVRLASVGGQALRLAGHLVLAGGSVSGGVIRLLGVGDEAPARRLDVAGGWIEGGDVTVELREATLGLAARLPSGERIVALSLRLRPDGAGEAALSSMDDLAPLRAAVDALVAAAATNEKAALGDGPLRRRAVLRELEAALARG